MSTAARELEELRKIREAERLRKEEEQRIADEKAAKIAKKNEFLNRANAFQQKKGPTDEEVKAQVHKASEQRKFGRELNKMLKNEPGKNSIALELGLKAKHGHGGACNDDFGHVRDGESPWELVHQENDRPYYWNRITNETTFDKPDDSNGGAIAPPPPPPPPRRLPGMPAPAGQPQQPPLPSVMPPPRPAPPTALKSTPDAPKPSAWTYVFENEPNPYYWNTETNETTFDRPDAYVQPYVAPREAADECVERGQEAMGEDAHEEVGLAELDLTVMWQEVEDAASGETSYVNMASGETRLDQPVGTVIVVVADEQGGEENWQVCVYEDESSEGTEHFGTIYYQNLASGEVREDRPEGGSVMIIEKGSD